MAPLKEIALPADYAYEISSMNYVKCAYPQVISDVRPINNDEEIILSSFGTTLTSLKKTFIVVTRDPRITKNAGGTVYLEGGKISINPLRTSRWN